LVGTGTPHDALAWRYTSINVFVGCEEMLNYEFEWTTRNANRIQLLLSGSVENRHGPDLLDNAAHNKCVLSTGNAKYILGWLLSPSNR
jgi:hypothetical protein